MSVTVQKKITYLTVVKQENSVTVSAAGTQGPKGEDGDVQIDDDNIFLDKAYSSQKIEDIIDIEVGDEDLNFVLLFNNQLSQN